MVDQTVDRQDIGSVDETWATVLNFADFIGKDPRTTDLFEGVQLRVSVLAGLADSGVAELIYCRSVYVQNFNALSHLLHFDSALQY